MRSYSITGLDSNTANAYQCCPDHHPETLSERLCTVWQTPRGTNALVKTICFVTRSGFPDPGVTTSDDIRPTMGTFPASSNISSTFPPYHHLLLAHPQFCLLWPTIPPSLNQPATLYKLHHVPLPVYPNQPLLLSQPQQLLPQRLRQRPPLPPPLFSASYTSCLACWRRKHGTVKKHTATTGTISSATQGASARKTP